MFRCFNVWKLVKWIVILEWGLLGLYVMAYLMIVERQWTQNLTSGKVRYSASYPDPISREVFEPIHWFDRYMRPKYWDPPD